MTDSSRRERFYRYAPVFLWAGVIMYLSTGGGSMSETSRFIGPLLHWLFPAAPEETIRIYHGYIRKAAHFTEYAVLALLAARAFSGSASVILRGWWFACALVLSAALASVDELNQSFNTERTGSPYDVLIDLAGAVFAVLAFYFWASRRRSGRTPDQARN